MKSPHALRRWFLSRGMAFDALSRVLGRQQSEPEMRGEPQRQWTAHRYGKLQAQSRGSRVRRRRVVLAACRPLRSHPVQRWPRAWKYLY